ncbi:MAG TPA: hypothetical protein DEV73_02020 [Candidatus Zambryskibacteria bacterium]|nr:hypothetical protein [Candidatus Zambryskibacteria bacterium]
MKNSKKGFIVPVLLAVIAVLAIGGGVYIYNKEKAEAPATVDTSTQQTNTETPSVNTQADTSNWKTYTNTQYGFEFKYPANGYKFGAVNSNDTFAFGLSEFQAGVSQDVSTDDPEYLPHFRFLVLTPTQTISNLTTYIRSLMNNSHGSPDEYVSSQYIDINGAQWLKVRSSNDFMGSSPGDYNYFIYSNNKLYWMGLWGASSVDLAKILSTFKFTK